MELERDLSDVWLPHYPTATTVDGLTRRHRALQTCPRCLPRVQSLESTVVTDNALVNTALFTLYGVFTLACLVAPKVVGLIGPKMAMVVGAVPYVLLVFANMAPSYYTFIPSFAGVGLGAAILWTGQGMYLSRCSINEAAATGESTEVVSSRFNGVFWTAFQFNAAVGLIASSIILQAVPNFKRFFRGL